MSAATEDDPRIGTTLDGRYRLVRRLGVGGMGVVYEGTHLLIRRRVAIKMLHAHLATNAEVVARFHREALAASALRHPNVVELIDMGRADGAAYMALEFLEGRDWADDLRETGPQPLGRVARILGQVCEGLGAAHAKGIIHRDLKAENVFLCAGASPDPLVKIVDFGISKLLEEDAALEAQGRSLTKTGAAMGTPFSMAPEQMKGLKDVDARADVWALGVMLFRALTGSYPFDGETFPMLAVSVLTSEPAPLEQFRGDLPPELQSILARLLAKDRAARFQSVREVRAALAPYESFTEPAKIWRPSMVSAATLAPGTPAPLAVVARKQDTGDWNVTSSAELIGHVAPLPSAPVEASGRETRALRDERDERQSTGPLRAADAPRKRTEETAPLELDPAPRAIEAMRPAGAAQGSVWSGVVLAVVLIGLGSLGAIAAVHVAGENQARVDAATPESAPAPTTPQMVRIQVSTSPPEAELLLDGALVPNPFDADLPIDPAHHTLVARLAGHADETREITLAFPMRIALTLRPEPAPAAPPTHEPHARPSPTRPRTGATTEPGVATTEPPAPEPPAPEPPTPEPRREPPPTAETPAPTEPRGRTLRSPFAQ